METNRWFKSISTELHELTQGAYDELADDAKWWSWSDSRKYNALWVLTGQRETLEKQFDDLKNELRVVRGL